MSTRSKFYFFILLFGVYYSNAQNNITNNLPQNYFRNPLNIPLQLSANFGAIRTEHFHMGLDIRTNKKENYPVFAAANGYISRIKIEQFGYGRAIYITHPNGYTTVYAHLNNFYDTLNSFVKNKQYKDEQWEQDFELPPNAFTVVKGHFIAFSGNTGGSEGPHLHFEIRDQNDNNQNPLLFGFDIADNLPPVIDKLYYYDRQQSTYQTVPKEIFFAKNKNNYSTVDSIVYVASSAISFGVIAHDLMNNSVFKYGIYKSEVWVDSTLISSFTLNNFPYKDSRYINACVDYVQWNEYGNKIQHLSKLPNNKLGIFSANSGNGIIQLQDTSVKKIDIVLKDAYGNATTINFCIKRVDSVAPLASNQIVQNILIPNQFNSVNTKKAGLFFDKKAFYDTIFCNVTLDTLTNKTYNTFISLPAQFPVHNAYTVSFYLDSFPINSIQQKMIFLLQSKKTNYTQIPKWSNLSANASFNKLGKISLVFDTIAPVIKPVNFSNSSLFNNEKEIIFKIDDDISSIKKFRAELDGNWLMFSRRNDLFIYEFDERCTLGEHQLKITAEDEVGNIAEKIFPFIKEPPKLNKSKKKMLVKGKKKKQSSVKKKKKK